ncbi:MAG: hypothetical protein HOM07_02505 [Rhodospirillaceae bacterium]|nr:hypothetical protein [Rhodospirillaceae bacterium]MBT5458662.1 hypothetical protein [Rhodospirillaceae bacterium]
MTDTNDIRTQIEAVEEAYEYMLAYAAQGRADEGAGPDGAQIREFLRQFDTAVTAINGMIDHMPGAGDEAAGFATALKKDSETMSSVLKIMLARDNVSSEMVDNANGLIAVRSYLTSLFFLDKAVLA